MLTLAACSQDSDAYKSKLQERLLTHWRNHVVHSPCALLRNKNDLIKTVKLLSCLQPGAGKAAFGVPVSDALLCLCDVQKTMCK